jgi:hypothetical protein
VKSSELSVHVVANVVGVVPSDTHGID